MYKYTLKPYLLDCILRKRMEWGFVYQLLHDVGMARDFSNHIALVRHSNVTFYSKNKLLQVPASNGILLPVIFYQEEEI